MHKLYSFLEKYVLLILSQVIVLYKCYIHRYYFFDDTLIYARYIKNYINGIGLVYNEGDKFNGLTSPLYTYINIAFSCLFHNYNPVLMNNTIGTIFMICTIFLFYKILDLLGFNKILNGTILITYALSNIYMFLGMETHLYMFLILFLFYSFFKKKYVLYFIIAPLLFITRSEGMFFILTTFILFIIDKRRFEYRFIKLSIISVLILSLHYGFNLMYYDNLLPDSAKAKVYHGISEYWGGRKEFIIGVSSFITYDYYNRKLFRYIYYLLVFIIICTIVLKKKNLFDYYLIISNLLLISFYLYLKVPLFLWYIAPLIITKIYFVIVGINICIKKTLKLNLPTKVFKYIYFPLIFLSALTFNYNNTLLSDHGKNNKQREKDYIKIAEWLNKNTASNASIGTAEIGIIGYFTNLKIVDLCGLVTRNNAYYLSKHNLNNWIIEHKPIYILFHDPKWMIETNISKFPNYKKVPNFNFKGYILYKDCKQ